MWLYKYLNKAIIILLQALVFIVPLYFAFLYKDYSVFTVDKTVVFQILVEILLFLSILKIIIHRNINYSLFTMTGVKITSLFFIALVISVVFSTNIHQSFWGSYWRQQGLIVYIHYFLFFIVLLLNINSSKKIQKLISASLFGSLFVSILGILQWLGYDPLPWQERIPVFGRITSTMGQPIFLANYLLFVIPLTVYRIMRFSARGGPASGWKIHDLRLKTSNSFLDGGATMKQHLKNNTKLIALTLYSALLALQLSTLLFTYTRGAIIGLVFGILFFAVIYPLFVKRNKKALFKSFIALAVFVIVVFIILVSTRGGWNFSDRLILRMQNITNLSHGSTALRVKYWTSAIEAIKKKPFLGYGPENQQSVFVGYYDDTWIPYEKIGLIPDRAHNEFLDIAMSGGIVLLISYLIMIFYIFHTGLKGIYRCGDKNKQLLLTLILSSLFSYLVSSFFAFSVAETNVFFFLLIALVFILVDNFSLRGGDVAKQQAKEWQKQAPLQRRIVIYCIILVSPILVFSILQNVNMVRADYHFREARNAYVDRNYLSMYENYLETFMLNNREQYYKQSFIDDATLSMFRIDSSEYREAVTAYAKEFLSDYMEDTFYHAQARAKIYSLLGRFDDKKYLDLAENEYRQAISLNKYLPVVQMGLAQVYIEKKNYPKAIEVYKNIQSFLPNLDSRELNATHRKEVLKMMISIDSRIEYCNEQIGKEKP